MHSKHIYSKGGLKKPNTTRTLPSQNIPPIAAGVVCEIHWNLGSVDLLLHFTSSEVRFLDLVFLCGAGVPGNLCYGVQARLVNFALHLQKC